MSTLRRTGATSIGTLAAFAAAFLSVHLLAPQWARSAGLDVWELSDAAEWQKREQDRARDIDADLDRLADQIAAADAIATALIEGRMELDDAVDRVVEINRERPGFEVVLLSHYSGERTHRERVEQYLLAKVSSQLASNPSHRAEVLERIECSR